MDVKSVPIQTADLERDGRMKREHMPAKFDLRLRVFSEEPAFGKGVAQLMRLVAQKGSLSAAYKEMGMAASKAWKIVRRAEADLGFPLMESVSGGKSGGFSQLTPEGEDLLKRYEEFQEEVYKSARQSFVKHFGNHDTIEKNL